MTATFAINACYNATYLGTGRGAEAYTHHLDQPSMFQAMIFTPVSEMTDDLRAEYAAIAKSFPKWVNVKLSKSGHAVSFAVRFTPTKDNAANETGKKRVLRFLEIANVEFKTPALNSYATLEAFLAAV